MLGTSETWWSWGDLHRSVAAQTVPWTLGGPGSKMRSVRWGRVSLSQASWSLGWGLRFSSPTEQEVAPPTAHPACHSRLFLALAPGTLSLRLWGTQGRHPLHLDQGCDVSALPQCPAHCPQRPGWLPEQIHVAQLKSRAFSGRLLSLGPPLWAPSHFRSLHLQELLSQDHTPGGAPTSGGSGGSAFLGTHPSAAHWPVHPSTCPSWSLGPARECWLPGQAAHSRSSQS